jgi:hypothetical protein
VSVTEPPALEPDAARFRLLDTLTTLLCSLAGRAPATKPA